MIKVPLTVEATDLESVVLEVETEDTSVRLAYEAQALGVFDAWRETITVESGIACGQGPHGFLQYNGGLVARHPVCARVSAETPSGEALGATRVALGRASC